MDLLKYIQIWNSQSSCQWKCLQAIFNLFPHTLFDSRQTSYPGCLFDLIMCSEIQSASFSKAHLMWYGFIICSTYRTAGNQWAHNLFIFQELIIKKKKSTTDHTFIFTLQNAVYTVWKINRRGMNIVCEFWR